MRDRQKDFDQLISRIVDRRNNEDARRAWDELRSTSLDKRQQWLSQCYRQRRNLNDPVIRYLLQFGAWFPDEALAVLTPFADQNDPLALAILIAQLPAIQMLVNGRPIHPFIAFDGSTITLHPAAVGPIKKYLSHHLSSCSLGTIKPILEGLVRASSPEGFRLLTSFICSPQNDLDCRLMASVYIKMVAENITKQNASKDLRNGTNQLSALITGQKASEDLENEINQLSALVANPKEDINIRIELADGFRFFSGAGLAMAVRQLIDDIRRTGVGASLLCDVKKILEDIETGIPLTQTETPLINPKELSDLIIKVAGQPPHQIDFDFPKAMNEGSIIQLDNGEKRILHYPKEVVDHCLAVVPSLERYDAAWCERYTELLASVISAHGSPEEGLRCLASLARQAFKQGHLASVIKALGKAVNIPEKQSEDVSVFKALGEMGIMTGQRGMFDGQMDLAKLAFQWTAQLTQSRCPDLYGGAVLSMGVLASKDNDWGQAKIYLEKARSILEELGDRENLATCLMELAGALIETGQHSEARAYLERALTICEPLETPDNYTALPHCLSNLVEVGLQLKDIPQAELLKMLDRAQALSEKRQDANLMNIILNQRQRIEAPSFNLNVKRFFYQIKASSGNDLWAALEADVADAFESERMSILSDAGDALENRALFSAIKAYIRLAYAAEFEVLRHDVRAEAIYHSRDLENQLVRMIVHLMCKKGESAWALEFADRTKSRSLLYLWQLAHLDPLGLFHDVGLIAKKVDEIKRGVQNLSQMIHTEGLKGDIQERSLHSHLNELVHQLPAEVRESLLLGLASEDYLELQKEINAWNAELDVIKEASLKKRPREMPYTRQQPLKMLTIAQAASQLEPDERLIEYFLDDNIGYVFIATPEKQVHHVQLEISSERIQALVERITASPQIPNHDGSLEDWTPFLNELYAGLVRPLEPYLMAQSVSIKRLVIIPHGTLYNLPFSILRNKEQGRYLIQDYEIMVAINANLFTLMRRFAQPVPKQCTFAGMANAVLYHQEDLTNAIRELEGILKSVPQDCQVIGTAMYSELTRSRFVELCQQANIIHYAGHVMFLPGAPLDSYLPLAGNSTEVGARVEDRFTCAQLMEHLHLKANLFFLSGCESGRLHLQGEQEIAGFLRALIFCGAAHIVYTLWPIPDTLETAAIVTKFYRYYFADPTNCSGALRQAMLSLHNLHPWFWAGFHVVGG